MRTPAEWLTDSTTFTTSILALLADHFGGMEFANWDPLTVNLQISEDFHIDTPQFLLDRINAGSCLFTSPLFHRSLEAFSQMCNVFNFGAISSEVMVPADLDDVLWGVTEAMLLEGEQFDEEGFSHNIARYVGVLLMEEGIQQPPSVLRFAEYDEYVEANLAANLETSDATFAKVYWENQQADKDNLEIYNQQQLLRLLEQLMVLPIRDIRKEEFEGKIDKLRKYLESETAQVLA
jgi:hypothetical protein